VLSEILNLEGRQKAIKKVFSIFQASNSKLQTSNQLTLPENYAMITFATNGGRSSVG
jgi:hypothetical protein